MGRESSSTGAGRRWRGREGSDRAHRGEMRSCACEGGQNNGSGLHLVVSRQAEEASLCLQRLVWDERGGLHERMGTHRTRERSRKRQRGRAEAGRGKRGGEAATEVRRRAGVHTLAGFDYLTPCPRLILQRYNVRRLSPFI